MRSSHRLLATVAVLGVTACTDSATSPAPVSGAAFSTTGVTIPVSGPWARIVEGVVGPGALYALYIPNDWNGDAIFYVHGVRDVDSPIDLRDQDQFEITRELLGAEGFAIAYSSWSQNGVAIKDGAQRVHQLRGILAGELKGQPARSFILSYSLGSAVGLDLVQTYPNQYDGALLVCGMVGGTLLQSQYAGHVRALVDVFYPGRFPGDVISWPSGTPPITLNDVIAAVQSNPTPLFVIASLAQTPLPYVPVGNPFDPNSLAFQTLVGSLFGPLQYQARFANSVLDLTHGHPPFDNSTTTYSIGSNPLLPSSVLQPAVSLANATVTRYTMDQAATNFLEHSFTPTGALQFPVITLHTMWDPGIPAFHEAAFHHKVQAAGATQFLLQRYYPAYGHCTIPPADQAQNFLDLVDWVTSGNKPAN